MDTNLQSILRKTKTIAVVGFSSNPAKAGYTVPAYLQSQGYRIIPVNPHLDAALGEKAYAKLNAISEAIDLVLIFRRSEAVPPFVDQAIQLGAKTIWMQLGILHDAAAQKAQNAGLQVVMDRCMKVEHQFWMASR